MDEYIMPVVGALILILAGYYYVVVVSKPKKLASIPGTTVKKGTAAAAKKRPTKVKEEVRSVGTSKEGCTDSPKREQTQTESEIERGMG